MNRIKMFKTTSKAGNPIYSSLMSQDTSLGRLFQGGTPNEKPYFISIDVDPTGLPATILMDVNTGQWEDAAPGAAPVQEATQPSV